MTPVRVRSARAEDAEAISALITSLAHHGLADPDDPGAAAAFFATITPEALARNLADERFRYHVADADGALAGVIGMRDVAHLYHLFVAEPFRGRGIATRLWETARAEAVARGDPDGFTVNATRYAIPVYERLGFVPADALQVKEGLAYLPMRMDRAGTPADGG
jgi:GNAT superfamily N-acetyltransferase